MPPSAALQALSEVYDALSLRALERSAKLTETRLAALKKERADIMQAVKEVGVYTMLQFTDPCPKNQD